MTILMDHNKDQWASKRAKASAEEWVVPPSTRFGLPIGNYTKNDVKKNLET